MQIALGLGLGLAPAPSDGAAPAPAPTLALVLSPASPAPGDLVTLTGSVSGDPAPTGFSAVTVTIGGAAVLLTGTGLSRRFLARGGALAVSASVSTAAGEASDRLSADVAAGVTVASVVGFGSSTMAGDGASSTARRALTLIAGGMGAATIRNQGINGTVLQNSPDASGSPRAGNGRDRFVAALLGGNKSDRACLLYGANDLRYTGAPASFNLEGFRTDLAEVLNGLRAGGYAREEIVIGSPNWYPDATYAVGSTGFTGSNRMVHEAYVNACSEIAAEYGLAYADVYGKMRDLGGTALMSADGLHCNDAGHQVIAHAFLTADQLNSRAVPVPGAATAPAAGSLSLDWEAVPGATGYRVEAGVAGSYSYPLGADVAGVGHAFAGLAPGSYLARVRAVFADGAGPWAFWTVAVAVSEAAAGGGRVVTGASVFAGQTGGALVEDLAAVPGLWVRHPGSTGDALMREDGQSLRGQAATSRACIATLTNEALTAAGVFVELDYIIRSNSVQLTTYAVARANPGEVTLIAAGYNGAAWRVLKYVAGAVTVVGAFNRVEPVGSEPKMRFEVQSGVQRVYVNEVLVLTTNEPDSAPGTLGEGLGVRIGSGSASFTDTVGPQLTAIRVGRLPA